MQVHLDIRTLSIMASIINFIIMGTFIYIYFTRKTFSGFHYWIASTVFGFFGMLFLGLRNIIPDFLSIIVANTFLTMHPLCTAHGLSYFLNRKISRIYYYLPISLQIILFITFTYFIPDINIRIIIISFILSYYFSICIFLLYKGYGRLFASGSYFLVVSLIIVIFWYILRTFLTFWLESPIGNFMNASSIQSFSLLMFVSTEILIPFGLIILNSQRVEQELQTKMDEIKRLRGIIPICSGCKKIRDDKGYWQQVELYIKQHSEAEFSHGLCPECSKKYQDE